MRSIGAKLVLAALAVGALTGSRAEAQFVANPFGGGLNTGMQSPRIPPRGDWAQVVSVSPKWLVIQNEEGQQFPVAFDEVRSFMMRWPSTVDRISPTALVEALGVNNNSNRIITDHVDVYDGAARALVAPLVQNIVGYNRILTQDDIQMMNIGVVFPLLPGENNMPPRLHVVGPIVNADPLMIALPNNSEATVFPNNGELIVNNVTPGSAAFVEPGDWVYYVPTDYNAKSLVLSELWVYKKVPFDQFGQVRRP